MNNAGMTGSSIRIRSRCAAQLGEITPQATRAPLPPVGWVTKSSGRACTMMALPSASNARPGREREVLDRGVEVTLAGHVDDEVRRVTGMLAVGHAERVVVCAGGAEVRSARADPVDMHAMETRWQPGDPSR
jgi:hypothetical protein